MTVSYGTKSVLVSDNGLFSELARTLNRSFGKVYYCSPWLSDFPSSYRTELGEGFSEFERVDDVWEVIDDVDLFIFPDMYQGGLQEHLSSLGKRVWGSRYGDEIENYRSQAKALFTDLGIPQAPYEVVKGITALRKYVKSRGNDKLWVKISLTRDDTETFSVEGYDLHKNRFDALEARFGPTAEYREFIVEDHLPDTLDIAIDTYSIDGKYPSRGLLGNEHKDEGYIGVVKEWGKMPPGLVDVYEKLSPTLKDYSYRNFFAVECRVGKGELALTDPCLRVGSPIFELELNMISNLPEILWEGAEGKLVDPKYGGKYGFEVLLQSKWLNDNPLLVEFPAKYREQIKFRRSTQFPDGLWIMPQPTGEVFGSVVAFGDDMDALFEEVAEISGEIKGIQVEAFTGSVSALKENLQNLAKWGVTF